MWGVMDESADEPLSKLWGLFQSGDDLSWQHKALCSQTDPEGVSFRRRADPPGTPSACAPSARCVNSAWIGPSNTTSDSASGAA